jgi:hypothetical protein
MIHNIPITDIIIYTGVFLGVAFAAWFGLYGPDGSRGDE